PLRTGYDASTTFAVHHQQGFLGMDQLRWEAFVGSLVKPDNGLVVLAPWLLLAVPGIALLGRRKDWATMGVVIAVIVIYVAFISAINFWRGGWCVGPRYITALLPFLVPAVVVTLAELQRV